MKVVLNSKLTENSNEVNQEELKAVEESKTEADKAKEAIARMNYTTINKYGWDQTDKAVKIYITAGLDGIKDLPEDKIHWNLGMQDFDLRIDGLNGKNYRLKVP